MKKAIEVHNLSKKYQLGTLANANVFFFDKLLRGVVNTVRSGTIPQNTRKTFWALKDVSFTVNQGEVVGIIGRNGAGKSTLLKILSRITQLTSGQVDLYGRTGSLLEVGVGFHPELTGEENIYLNGMILGMTRPEIKEQFDQIVEFAEVSEFIHTPVKRYSSGMYVRLAFAVAAHLSSDILIVDEVLAVGDVEFQRKSLGKMGDIVNNGRAVLFVSHNMASIKALCSRVIVLDKGQLVYDGDADTAIEKYLNLGNLLEQDGIIPEDAYRVQVSDEIALRQVNLTTLDGTYIRELQIGQPFKVALTFEVFKPVHDVIIELGFTSRDGVRFATVFSHEHGFPPVPLSPGLHTIYVTLNDLQLLPRDFVLDVATHHFDNRITMEWMEATLRFSVIEVGYQDVTGYGWHKAAFSYIRGYMRPKADWSVED